MSKKNISNVLVVGAGAWGGAIANLIAGNLCCDSSDDGSRMSSCLLYGNEDFEITQSHPKLGMKLNHKIRYTKHFDEVRDFLEIVDCIFLVVPSNALLEASKQLKNAFDLLNTKGIMRTIPIVICTKGLDGENNSLFSESLNKIFSLSSNSIYYEVGVLSGPNFAKQVALGNHAITNVAFKDISTAEKVSKICANEYFDVKCIQDTSGLQILGAYKNVLALTMGIIEGKGYSTNSIAKYLCSCISEIKKLIKFFGGKESTILEPCGIGDIYLTCTSKESRNTSFGFNIAKYETIGQYYSENESKPSEITVEGVNAVKSLKEISDTNNLGLALIEILHNILFNGQVIKNGIEKLLTYK